MRSSFGTEGQGSRLTEYSWYAKWSLDGRIILADEEIEVRRLYEDADFAPGGDMAIRTE